jgi:hypothetical protein
MFFIVSERPLRAVLLFQTSCLQVEVVSALPTYVTASSRTRSSLDLISSTRVLPAVMIDLELAAAQLAPEMLAQRLLADAKLLGDVGLGDAKSRGVLNESAGQRSAHIRRSLTVPVALLRDARALYGKLSRFRPTRCCSLVCLRLPKQ